MNADQNHLRGAFAVVVSRYGLSSAHASCQHYGVLGSALDSPYLETTTSAQRWPLRGGKSPGLSA